MNGGTLVKKRPIPFSNRPVKEGYESLRRAGKEALSCLLLEIVYKFLKSLTFLDELTLFLTYLNMDLLASFSLLAYNVTHQNSFSGWLI